MIKTRAGEVAGSGASRALPERMRVYRFRDLRPAGAVFTRKHITELEKRGEFPMHFRLGDYAVGWVAAEVDAWVEQRIRSRRPAVSAQPQLSSLGHNGGPRAKPPKPRTPSTRDARQGARMGGE